MSTQTSYISAGPYYDVINGVQLIFSFSDGVVRITGEEQSGKSRLLDALLDTLQDEQQLAMLFKLPPKSPLELHNHLTRELSLPANMGFRKALARFITARPRDKQHLILLVDDADHMDAETLFDLMQLREVSNNGQSLVSIVLAGLPRLNEQLAAPELSELVKDLALSYELAPMNLKQLDAFCNAAITTRDLKIPRPTARTLEYILAETGGLPGRVLTMLPLMVAEPEPALVAAAAEPTAEPVAAAPSRKPAPAPAAERPTVASLASRLHLPFDASKLRQGLYGGAAIAATVAAVWLLYPQLQPLLQKPAPQPVVSTPAPAPAAPPAQPQTPVATPEVATTEVATAEPASTETVATAAPEPSATAPDATPAAPALVAESTTPAQPAAPGPAAAPAPAVATLTPPEPVVVMPPPATRSVVPTIPAAALQDLTPEALEGVVRNWLSAWQDQDLDAYFGAYHTDFAPIYQGTRADWRNNRSNNITRPAAISLAMEDFAVNGESAIGTHVSFWLEYQTATYADRTLKELVIGHDLDGSLRILQEVNRQVTTLAPSEVLGRTDPANIAAAPTPAAPPATVASRSGAAGTTRTLVGPPIQHRDSITIDNDALSAAASVSADQGAALQDFLGSWLQAWQQQDVAAYFSHYHPDFRVTAFPSRVAWEEDRIRKITRPLAIQIHLQNLQVLAASGSQGQVELLMEYHSSYYADRTRKAMTLQRAGAGSWLITEERNLEVEALPLARLIPGTSLTLRAGSNTIFERAL